MIDLDELQAAINRCEFDGDVLGLSKAECSDLLGRLRQAEKDAARYRWVIEQFWFQDEASWRLDIKESELSVEFSDDVGKAIDEAMQCK